MIISFNTLRTLSNISKDFFFFLNPSKMAFQESATKARGINIPTLPSRLKEPRNCEQSSVTFWLGDGVGGTFEYK